jgi:hypothetical protein
MVQKYKSFYSAMWKFLLSQEGITDAIIQAHLKPEHRKNATIEDIYYRLCFSAQNRQMSNRVIAGSIDGLENLSGILHDFNPKLVVEKYGIEDYTKLFTTINKKLKPNGKMRDNNNSIWPKYCKTIIQGAHFMARFEDSKDFYKWANYLSKDNRSLTALPLFISSQIDGIGFALACDFLKEIGFSQYGKPDVHINKILLGADFLSTNSKKHDYESIAVLSAIADANETTAYHVDRLLWLIGSGTFWKSNLKIGRQSDAFLKYIKK